MSILEDRALSEGNSIRTENRCAFIMAGGTGGHIFPALALADALRARGWRVEWLGTATGLEARLVPARGYRLNLLKIKGLRGNGVMGWVKLPVVLLRAFWDAARFILWHRPDIAVGFGGYPAFAGGVMMRFFMKPLIIHEQNSIAGLTNRVLDKISSRTLFAFPSAFSDQTGLIGNPVRPEIAQLPAPEERFSGRSGRLRVLIVGGSLGAKALNECLPQAFANCSPHIRPEIVHQAGAKHLDELKALYAQLNIEADVREFIDDMASEYAAADLVICRAGALTIAELSAAGCASVLIPFPHAVDDHQTMNAKFLEASGAAVLLPQSELSAESFAQFFSGLTREQCLSMAKCARSCARIDAVERLVEVCQHLAD